MNEFRNTPQLKENLRHYQQKVNEISQDILDTEARILNEKSSEERARLEQLLQTQKAARNNANKELKKAQDDMNR